MRASRAAAIVVMSAISTLMVAGCGGGSGAPPTRPSASVDVSRTPLPGPTRSTAPDQSETPNAPTTRTPRTDVPTSAAPPAETTAPSSSSSGSGTTWWPWVVLAVVLLAALAWFLFRRSRRRTWDTRFTTALGEARWMTTVVTESLLSPTLSADASTLYWNESRPRVERLHDELSALGTSRPDKTRGARVERVFGSLTPLAASLTALVTIRGAAPDSDLAVQRSRADVQQRARTLQDAIGSGGSA